MTNPTAADYAEALSILRSASGDEEGAVRAIARLILKAKEETRPRWTTERPATEGWYWRRNQGFAQIVKIKPWPRTQLLGWAGDCWVWLGDDTDAEWAGPLPLPTEGA